MIPLPATPSPHRAPDMDRSFLALVLLVSGTVTLPQALNLGPVSGLGAWTILISSGAWVLWFMRPYFPRELLWTLLPLVLFGIFATFSLSWGGLTVEGLQNLAVSAGFAGFVLLAARECERSPGLAQRLHRTLDVASVLAGIGYTLTVLWQGPGGEVVIGGRQVFMVRPFALFATVALARQIARWMSGDGRGLWVALWLVALVFLSHSRLAMVACLALFPLAYLCRGDRGGFTMAVTMTAIGAAVLVLAVMLSQDLYDRFFGFDASLKVGGVSFNASGRTEAWNRLLDDLNGGAKLFGKGAGASANFVSARFENLTHPHNDFLRFYYDYGAFGLFWWVAFLAAVAFVMLTAVRRAVRLGNRAEVQYHLAPLLALAGVCASLFTDNSISYIFVMAPLGMLIGCSLSRLNVRPPQQAVAQPVAAAPVWTAAQLALAYHRPLFLPAPGGDSRGAKPQAAAQGEGLAAQAPAHVPEAEAAPPPGGEVRDRHAEAGRVE